MGAFLGAFSIAKANGEAIIPVVSPVNVQMADRLVTPFLGNNGIGFIRYSV
jgi:hypothetical protein